MGGLPLRVLLRLELERRRLPALWAVPWQCTTNQRPCHPHPLIELQILLWRKNPPPPEPTRYNLTAFRCGT